MKRDIHPKYRDVLFVDSATGHRFVCGSALEAKETAEHEGVEYPVRLVSVSSSSHPFWTKSKSLLDQTGRIDKFNKRYGSGTK